MFIERNKTKSQFWQHTFVSPSAFSRRAVVSYWRKYVHEVLVNRLGGLSLPSKSVVWLTDHPNMTLDVYRRRKTTMQQQNLSIVRKTPSYLGLFCKNTTRNMRQEMDTEEQKKKKKKKERKIAFILKSAATSAFGQVSFNITTGNIRIIFKFLISGLSHQL